MEKFISYFLSINLLLLLQAVYYRLLLARQQRFVWNRVYLLGGMVAALVLPLIHWEVVPPSLPNPSFIPTLPEIVIGAVQPVSVPSPAAPVIAVATIAWESVVLWLGLAVYGVGVAIALGALLLRNLKIINLIRKGQKSRHEGYTLVTTTADIGPASYFRFIFWNAGSDLDPQSTAVAMAHERCHSRQLHSLDLLGVELMKAFCWINPAIYMLRKDLRVTHEFLADQAALEVAGSEGIKRLLLMRQLGMPHLAIANYFHSHIKARIMMLTKISNKKAILQYVLVAPLVGLMVACTSLGHPLDGPATINAAAIAPANSDAAATSDAATTTVAADAKAAASTTQDAAAYPEYFKIEDVFVRAALPIPSGNPEAKGMVCLGEQPQVLNLDTILSLDELENVANHPKLLNRDRIMSLIGYPKEAQDQKIKGKVVTKILVDETGHVIRYQFVGESNKLLRDAVEAHIEELLFKPGMKAGKVDKWWVIMPFSFGMPGC